MDDWSARQTTMVIGQVYRVLHPARSTPPGPGFEVGEMVCLQRINYSRYDSSYFYAFTTAGGVNKSFVLHDNEPLTALTGIFA